MGIFRKNKEKTEIYVPEENLAFYWGGLKKKDTYDSIVVSCMPFDISEISGMDDSKKWERLKDLSVAYERDVAKNLPSFAKEQDYERTGGASYQAYKTLVAFAEKISTQESDKESEPIKLFNNAFDKIVLPNGFREKIIETVSQLKDHKKMFEEWGLGDKVKRGKGVNILFSGVSGTGKTWCGEVIAEYLGTDAEIISVATLESKWVGESEKNVSNLFKGLNGNNKVLILDEVDSFISRRSDNDSGNPYQNKLTNQFLIELERHDGICIMTTNRPVKLDKALQRRVDLVLDFPFPDIDARESIWKYMIPSKMPTDTIDYKELAKFSLNGGQIKNALFGAARKAIVAGSNVTMKLLKTSCKEEMEESDTLINGKDHS